jgi:hypothetical protein
MMTKMKLVISLPTLGRRKLIDGERMDNYIFVQKVVLLRNKERVMNLMIESGQMGKTLTT